MGLPIWNYPDDKKEDRAIKESNKNDGTATSRSSIRRHSSIHGRRGNVRADGTNEVVDLDGLRASRHRIIDTAAALDNDENPPPVPDPVPNSRSHDPSASTQLRGGTRGPRIVAGPTTFSLRDDAQSRLDAESAGRINRRHRRYETAVARTRRHVRRRDGSDRWIPPPSEHARPQSPDHHARRNNLPTPPLDTSMLPSPSEILARSESRQANAVLPSVNDILARSQDQDPPRYSTAWPRTQGGIDRTLSPDNGLGDRRRSVSSSADVWQVMRNTITPDDSLPSTSSSFASAAAADASFHDNHQTAAIHPRGEASHGRDTLFEQALHDVTMYHTDSSEAIVSDRDDSGHDDQSMTSESDDNTSDDDDGSDEMEIEEQEQRRHIALQLYDLAMATPEGREQIESLRRPTTSQNPLPIPDESTTRPSVPLPEPQQFGTEVHDRAQEATSLTRAFFAPGDGMTQEEYEEESARLDRASNQVDHISRMLDTLNEDISHAPSAGARTRELNQMRDAMRRIADRTQHSRTRVTDILQSQLDGTDDSRSRLSTRVIRRQMSARDSEFGPARPPLRGMVARRSRPTRGGRHTEPRAEGEARVLHL